jgi:hypothetical protein
VLFRLLQSVRDSPLDAALFVLLVSTYVMPLAFIATLLWKRRNWRPNLADWRWRVWNGGLFLAAVAAVAVPIFMLGIQFLSEAAKDKWFIDAGTRGMFFALVIAPVAVILLCFGKGKQRWMGILSGLISFAGLYISLAAAAF